jgi:hypothetical protein
VIETEEPLDPISQQRTEQTPSEISQIDLADDHSHLLDMNKGLSTPGTPATNLFENHSQGKEVIQVSDELTTPKAESSKMGKFIEYLLSNNDLISQDRVNFLSRQVI